MRLTTNTLALALIFGGATAASAQTPGAQPANPSAQTGPQFDADRFVKDHDKNNDAKLGKDELPSRLQGTFAEVDKDGDGQLTAQELRQHAQAMATRRPQMIDLVYYVIDYPEPEPMNTQELERVYGELRKMDKNGDGKFDAQEIAAFRADRRKERLERTFEELDRDNDKKVSKSEARGVWSDDFDKLDTNRDGSLDEREIEAAYNLKPAMPEEKK